jgi:pimeloyl-ACP methyl ester carboxylesterase
MSGTEDWEHVYVETNGIRLHCVTQGEGDLVVLIHGFPEFWYSWRHQIGFLARRFKVVAPDMRGYGDSDKPAPVEAYGLGELTADVKGLIEAFGASKAHIVGHDWGGAVAWTFPMIYPDHTDKLVVMNAPHPAVFAANLMRNPRQLMRSWYMLYFQIPRLPEASIRAGGYYALKRTFLSWACDKEAFSDEDIRRLVEAAAKPGALTGGINYYRAMFRSLDLRHLPAELQVPRIKSPTLLIWAEEDRALGKELTYGMERLFDNSFSIKYLPGCSHWVQQEQPLLVNQYLDEFLQVPP